MFRARGRVLIGSVSALACYSHNAMAVSLCIEENNDVRKSSAGNESPYDLKHVIIIMRHGDRAPVSKSIGPNYPHNKEVEDIWRTKIASGTNEELLKGVAKLQANGGDDNIYTGRDIGDSPYGQLTDIGVNQLRLLGQKLRNRYLIEDKFLPETLTGDIIYTRSTNMCRTMNSLRSLLIGLYGIESLDDLKGCSFPTIRSYPTHHDPMIDGVTTNLEEKNAHRKMLFEKHSLPHGFVDFKAVNEKLKKHLGYPHRVNYHVIRENLVCLKSHGLALPSGLGDDDIAQQYELELWVAGILYGDRKYNSHEIGSFMEELRDRLVAVTSGAAKERLSVYSAHDYTLLPLLIGLDIMPDDFPYYASSLRMEVAVKGKDSRTSGSVPSTSSDSLYVRLLWNDKELCFPGYDVWCPIEVVVRKLHAGYLGVAEDSVESGEDSSTALNSLNELDEIINDALMAGMPTPAATATITATATESQ